MIHLGFRLVGQEQGKRLLPGWNAHNGMYSFVYKHGQSGMTFTIKCTSIADKLIVYGVAEEQKDKIYSIQLDQNKISTSNIRVSHDMTPQTIDQALASTELEGYIDEFYSEIIDRLAPGLGKAGYEHLSSTQSTQTNPTTTPGSSSGPTPLGPFSSPGYHEPYYHNPYSVGDVDLDPFAASPSLLPPGRRVFPPGGGMIVGPEHPMFMPNNPSRFSGRLPPGAVPPGARFDPITPLGPRPFPSRPFRPQFPGNFPRNNMPFSGDPDNDELPPPGYNDMFM